ncbi:MAG TPA: four helix bundle protein [Candidatus Limnocylindria bacterium]|jgi:four helix bundle protein|nr:four helix bundle protein [Candidatus Limnocylindria bacterium]
MASIKQFEDIEAWKEARAFTKAVYIASSSGAFAKDFGLRDQMRRASVSILSNIAEGFERGGDREFVQFLSLAKGSCGEERAQLYVAFDQGYLTADLFQQLQEHSQKISRLLGAFMAYLKRSDLRGAKFNTSLPNARPDSGPGTRDSGPSRT